MAPLCFNKWAEPPNVKGSAGQWIHPRTLMCDNNLHLLQAVNNHVSLIILPVWIRVKLILCLQHCLPCIRTVAHIYFRHIKPCSSSCVNTNIDIMRRAQRERADRDVALASLLNSSLHREPDISSSTDGGWVERGDTAGQFPSLP